MTQVAPMEDPVPPSDPEVPVTAEEEKVVDPAVEAKVEAVEEPPAEVKAEEPPTEEEVKAEVPPAEEEVKPEEEKPEEEKKAEEGKPEEEKKAAEEKPEEEKVLTEEEQKALMEKYGVDSMEKVKEKQFEESEKERKKHWRHPQLNPDTQIYTKRDGTEVYMPDYIAAGGQCNTVVAADGSQCKIVTEPPLKSQWQIEREMNSWKWVDRNPPRSRDGKTCNIIMATILSCGLGGCNCNENDVYTHLRCCRYDTHNYKCVFCIGCLTCCCFNPCCWNTNPWQAHAGNMHKKFDVAFYPTNEPKKPKKEEPKKEEMER